MTQSPKIAAIIAAAGFSRRFGDENKLMAQIGARSLLEASLSAYKTAPLARKIAVLQADSPLAALCQTAGFEIIINPKPENGMGSSIACGIGALDDETHALIGLADMPNLKPDTVSMLCRAIDASHGIIIPTHDGTRGNPRLFSRPYFAQLAQLSGEKGGKAIITACPNVLDFAVNDDGILHDVDTPKQLAELSI